MAAERFAAMTSRWPVLALGGALAAKFDVLADYSKDDFDRLVTLLAWLERNPRSDLYLRQLPVEGLDTKWLEKRTGLVAGLLQALRDSRSVEDGDFRAVCGLRKPAHRVRIRLLCPALRSLVGGLGDIEAPVAELAALPIAPRAVVIGARRALPQLRSVLMDEATLLSHRALWVQESSQCSNVPLDVLTMEERAVYDHLRAGTWGQRVRLEQERLGWNEALGALMSALQVATGGPASGEAPTVQVARFRPSCR